MAEKNFNNVRIINKHDTEANWIKATGFIPKQGELIIYDKDSTYNYERFKIGDGSTVVNSLPFADANKVDKVSGKGLSTNDYTTAEKNKLAGIAEGANKTVVDSALSASSTNPVQNKVVNTAISNLNDLVGGTKVSDQINTAIANKSDVGHTHDDKYYTESEIDSKLSGKSDSGHTHSNYVNQNAFSKVTIGSTTIEADNATDTLTLVAGSNVTLTPDASGDKITIAATDTVYTHPNSGVTAGTYKSVTVNAQGHVTAGTNPTTLSGYGITDAATKTELSAVSTLVGNKKVSEQIAAAQLVYVGPTMPTDPNIKVWINTAEDGTGVIPVLPIITSVNLPASGWTGSNPYSQTVDIPSASSTSMITMQPSATQILALQDSEISMTVENNGNGVVTFYAIGDIPTSNMSMQILITPVSYV